MELRSGGRWRFIALLLSATVGAATLSGTTAAPSTAATPVTFADDFNRANGAPGSNWNDPRGAWAITSGKVGVTGTAKDRVLSPSSIALGTEFSVSADVAIAGPLPTSRVWNGLAVNVQAGAAAGTQDFYVFRVTHDPAGNAGYWQFGQINDSQDLSMGKLIASGRTSQALQGDVPVKITLSSKDDGRAIGYQVLNTAGTTLVDQTSYLPLSDSNLPALAGGGAGIYSLGGKIAADNFSLKTNQETATVPAVLGALNCPAVQGPAYDLGSSGQVAATSVIDQTWAGHPVGQSLLSDGNVQYVAYYDENRIMTVGKRSLPNGQWAYKQLDSTLGWDAHNYVTMALDPLGNLHVSGNMHNVPIVYYKTTTPGDISTLTRLTQLVDAGTEQSATYPNFIKGADGRLVYTFRNGSSGDGDQLFYRFNETSNTFSPLLNTPLFDGAGLRSAYFDGPKLGPDGYFHVAYVWRDSPDSGTNQRLSYMKSQNLTDWVSASGQPLTLPLRYDTGDVVDDIPTFGGVLNGATKLGFDNQGKVTISYYKYAEDGTTQLFVARPNSTNVWQSTQVSNWEGRFQVAGTGSLAVPVTIAGTVPLGNDRVRLDYICNGNRKSLILSDNFVPVTEVPTPSFPDGFLTPESSYPGIGVKTAPDLSGPQGNGRYVLRWESLPANGDKPRTEWPTAGELRVYFIQNEAPTPSP